MTTKHLKFSKIKTAAYNPRVPLTPEDPEWKAIEASLRNLRAFDGRPRHKLTRMVPAS